MMCRSSWPPTVAGWCLLCQRATCSMFIWKTRISSRTRNDGPRYDVTVLFLSCRCHGKKATRCALLTHCMAFIPETHLCKITDSLAPLMGDAVLQLWFINIMNIFSINHLVCEMSKKLGNGITFHSISLFPCFHIGYYAQNPKITYIHIYLKASNLHILNAKIIFLKIIYLVLEN